MGVKVIKTIQAYPKFERTNLQYEVDYDYERSQCKGNKSFSQPLRVPDCV